MVVAGLVVGAGTQILQGVLPSGWGVLANSGVMWAVTAFALGSALPSTRWGAAGGATELVVASIAYYAAADWFDGAGSGPRGVIVWSIAGVVAGSAFGLAGSWFTHRPAWRAACLSLVAGTLIGEGIHLTWFVGNRALRPAGLVELAIGVAITGWCVVHGPRRAGRRAGWLAVLVTVAAAIGTLGAGVVIETAFGALADSRAAFATVRDRLVARGASDGSVEDLGAFHALWFEDPDGMRGEVTPIIDPSLAGIHAPVALATP